ncbi:MAG: AAA family ATPase, partial [Clostridia bacterium]|nr:AAA family ATPase [Clostridia bacterium]
DNIRKIIEQSIKDDINVLSLFDGGSVVFSISVNEDRNDWLIMFMKLYRQTCEHHHLLDFSWGLSSGENNLLRLFSTLFYSLDYSKAPLYNWKNQQQIRECQSLIIFMDEADLTYHPEWQRQLIKILTAFLPLEFGDCGLNSIQLILTTHSPLLLGDIPPNNVIYLKENTNNINTFGQNIHTILKDSFFLKNGIGAFAADKINRTAKILKYQKKKIIKIRKLSVKKTSHKKLKIKKAGLKKIYSKQLSECKLVIDLLAPGIIKNRLTEFYDSAVNDNDIAVESIKKYAENLSNKELDEIIKKYQEVREMRGNNDKN